MSYWVYILQNPSGRFYIGQTADLDARESSHNRTDKTLGKFTRKNGPWILVWSAGAESLANFGFDQVADFPQTPGRNQIPEQAE